MFVNCAYCAHCVFMSLLHDFLQNVTYCVATICRYMKELLKFSGW